MKALCVRLTDSRDQDSWLTLNKEYQVLSVLMTPRGPAKLRIIADDGRTPILVEAPMFAIIPQPLPPSWALVLREGGVIELGPPAWLELGFWERYFDQDKDAVMQFQRDVAKMVSVQ